MEVKFTERLKELMAEKGWDEEELGARLDATPRLVRRFLNGESRPKLVLLAEMSLLFKVSLDYLLGFSDDRKPKKRK